MDNSLPATDQISNPIFRGINHIYNNMHWFTDKEAWTLYRVFAFGEAIGWTMLISAITYKILALPGYAIVISIAGTTHGLLFGMYFLFVLLTARSMKWGPWRVSGALLAGMPPYTAIVFEQVMAHHRKNHPVYVKPPANID